VAAARIGGAAECGVGEGARRGIGDGLPDALRDDHRDISTGEILLMREILIAGDESVEAAFSASSSNRALLKRAQPISMAVRTSAPAGSGHGMFRTRRKNDQIEVMEVEGLVMVGWRGAFLIEGDDLY
jgi:hypothetical protein